MKSLYLLPHQRSTYRVIETREKFCPWRVQRRWRWLWFEYWVTVGDWACPELFWSKGDAEEYIEKLIRMDAGGRVVEVR